MGYVTLLFRIHENAQRAESEGIGNRRKQLAELRKNPIVVREVGGFFPDEEMLVVPVVYVQPLDGTPCRNLAGADGVDGRIDRGLCRNITVHSQGNQHVGQIHDDRLVLPGQQVRNGVERIFDGFERDWNLVAARIGKGELQMDRVHVQMDQIVPGAVTADEIVILFQREYVFQKDLCIRHGEIQAPEKGHGRVQLGKIIGRIDLASDDRKQQRCRKE